MRRIVIVIIAIIICLEAKIIIASDRTIDVEWKELISTLTVSGHESSVLRTIEEKVI